MKYIIAVLFTTLLFSCGKNNKGSTNRDSYGSHHRSGGGGSSYNYGCPSELIDVEEIRRDVEEDRFFREGSSVYAYNKSLCVKDTDFWVQTNMDCKYRGKDISHPFGSSESSIKSSILNKLNRGSVLCAFREGSTRYKIIFSGGRNYMILDRDYEIGGNPVKYYKYQGRCKREIFHIPHIDCFECETENVYPCD